MELFDQLCLGCRTGDEETVDKLLTIGVDPNQADEFDYTPLYLASLCGHENIVKMLLDRGAICDMDKYEGARCVYGALTDSIRNYLISFDISKAVDARLPFASHLRSLMKDNSTIVDKDCVVRGKGGKMFKAHKFMLNLRSGMFCQLFLNSNDNEYKINSKLVNFIINYCYLNLDFSEIYEDGVTIKDIEKFKINDEITTMLKDLMQIEDSRKKSSLIKHIQFQIVETSKKDFKKLAFEILKAKRTFGLKEQPVFYRNEFQNIYPDLMLAVNQGDEKNYYPIHSSILIKIEYFKVMFSSSFKESSFFYSSDKSGGESGEESEQENYDKLPVISFPIDSFEIAEIILEYVYFEDIEIPIELSLDLLMAGDLLLNDRIKTLSSIIITTNKENPKPTELFEILRTGWLTRSDKIEHYVAKTIAFDLDKYINLPEFHEIIVESSNRIKDRQETDTIELIDDIRFYLTKKWKIDKTGLFIGETNNFYHELPGYNDYENDLNKIEDLLSALELNA